MRIFFAARTARRGEVNRLARDLATLGFQSVNPPWDGPAYSDPNHATDAAAARTRAETLRQAVASADLVVAVAERRGRRYPGGGRHALLGLALGSGKPVWVVGEPEHALCFHPGVRRFADWATLRAALAALPRMGEAPRLEACAPTHGENAERFWAEHGANAVQLAPYLDRYAPGVAARVATAVHARQGVYAAILTAWRAAGRPYASVPEGEVGVSPETGAALDHDAAVRWFSEIHELAVVDHASERLANRRNDLLRTRPASAAAAHAASGGATAGGAAGAHGGAVRVAGLV